MKRAFYSLISTAYMLLAVQPACCQNMLNGVVTDSVSGQPLAFVSVGILGSNMGTLSDIDGKFGITGRTDNVLLFSYVGYMPAQVTVTDVGKRLHIKLKQQTTHLQEVTVTGGVNPAWRIIKAAQARREANNPENLSSFSYRTHNKFYITAQAADPAALSADTQTMKLNAMLKRQHLFLNESVTERKYKYPRYNNEKVIAAKTSGFKEVSMVALAGQFQPFGFYNNFIELLNKKYLNPLAINSLRKYDFTLEETLIQFPDTVFVISFIPLYGKNFDGLKGTLYISSKGYAVQNVIASPADTGYISFKMQQKYAFIDNKAWFPVQINTDLVFNKLNPKMPFMGVGRTYLTNIIIGEAYRKRDFIEDELEIPIEALSRPDSFWTKYLTENDSSTAKERRTYLALDSLMGKVQAPSKILNGIDYFTIGKLPWGKTDIDLNRIVQSNQYEAVRLGTGLLNMFRPAATQVGVFRIELPNTVPM